MARKKSGKKEARPGGEGQPARRGKRRSIRYEAVEEWPEDRMAEREAERQLGKPPEIALRKLPVAEALDRLNRQIRAHVKQGTKEVLVVHGKGQNSPGGVPVIGPLARRWCDDSSHLVESWREAPDKWGGSGAILVVLKKESAG